MRIEWSKAAERPWIVALCFLGVSGVFRLPLFFQSEADWDVSLYLLVADQWVQGHVPYTVVWDNKPPGIYFLFALAISVWRSVIAIRLLSWLFVFATCLLVYRLVSRSERGGRVAGLAAGILYAIFSAINGGSGCQTEIFVACLSMLGMLAVLAAAEKVEESSSALLLGLAGLSFGAAIMVKQVAIFDCLAATLVYANALLESARQSAVSSARHLRRGLVRVLVAGIGVVLVPALIAFLFWATGHLGELWSATYTANRVRTIGQPFNPPLMAWQLWRNLRAEPLPWVMTAAALVVAARDRSAMEPRERRIVQAALVWFATICLCMLLVFRTALYEHYFLQLAAPAAITGGWLLQRLIATPLVHPAAPGATAPRPRYAVMASLLALLLLVGFPFVRDGSRLLWHRVARREPFWGDEAAHVASVLRARLPEGASIYVVDTAPVIYFLTGARLPTRYVFPAFLIPRRDLPNITGVDPVREVERILGEQRPQFVVQQRHANDRFYTPEAYEVVRHVHMHLQAEYSLTERVGSVDIYKRRASSVARR